MNKIIRFAALLSTVVILVSSTVSKQSNADGQWTILKIAPIDEDSLINLGLLETFLLSEDGLSIDMAFLIINESKISIRNSANETLMESHFRWGKVLSDRKREIFIDESKGLWITTDDSNRVNLEINNAIYALKR
jgi:hypothetical protein